ncbi:NAD/NADP octopine/nopaline dehydrogenase-like protein [Saccharopolyspora erythraea NRRL 2338]|uniref:NAD/NADP octopine/nopaline dehydrogenase n=2 Tax=Saccharopolyspora erythraea TaxID=1836 RepID=A4FJ06_SACEN|nr:NAD/NADP-dependent octopine/nopaline dehydrogenase family protein [Saccharopolyspora erythraea]EQD86168.1 NAD/NADP octopine/nopaline dehydrogenase [Saccharopolyspora erythraea D]PFG97701.1 NAD/NADP octopine/nopaline dehydrogenase-like protein [Saccharopolyspora erythraea NRRL 2338]QRK87850.1 NAD/NADP octopine/nopaline dehydrogenase family protein [Saccharopolyspora erythraea]CAM04031.1 NAD/NADP octopine/nopaline dehydrogenase [Saccharopolyspora erythraea NRRL 2338]
MDEIGVIGAGGEGLAVTAYLSSIGRMVRLCTRDPARIGGIRRTRSIRATGSLEGRFPVGEVTGDPAHLASHCRVLVVAAITTAYRDIARALAPHLTGDHVVVLFSSKLCGSAEFAEALSREGRHGVDVVETDALFAARPRDTDGVAVLGVKRWNLLSGARRESVTRCAPLLREWFPWVEPARNLIERGLTDFGAVAHAPIALANLGSIERGEELLFYLDGMSDRTVVLLEQAEREFRAVAHAYGADLTPMAQVLDRYYGCRTTCVLDAMRSVEAYQTIPAPESLDHRFLREDIASTLVPLEALAATAGVPTPMISSTINIMSLLSGEQFRDTGRTLHRLGWAELTHDEILDRISPDDRHALAVDSLVPTR